jgi:hypothetical protein
MEDRWGLVDYHESLTRTTKFGDGLREETYALGFDRATVLQHAVGLFENRHVLQAHRRIMTAFTHGCEACDQEAEDQGTLSGSRETAELNYRGPREQLLPVDA